MIIRDRARKSLDDRLGVAKFAATQQPPPKGWIRAIRDALGMSGAQMARRLGVSPQSLGALEQSEVAGTVQLNTLRRAAAALDCKLVYALIPNTSLEANVENRARHLAMKHLGQAALTMRLEAQGTDGGDIEERIQAYIRDEIKARDIWNEP